MSKYNYYTPIELAALLLELIPQKASISSAIDICCGSWNLLAAAKRHYPEVKIQKVEPCATYVYNTATSVYQAHYDSKWSIKLSFSITLRRILDGTWDNNSYTLAEDQHLQIYRGNISSKYFSKTGDVILHCSSTFVNNSWMPGLRYCTGTKASQRKYLNHGDIVINRIGRCAGYWSVYTGMQKLISDCLIVVKEPSDATIEALRNHSENGRLQIPLRGVSTPYITIDDVRSLLLNN